ncbi:hypothetical protein M514_26300 [Trichuris suis]|uniref:Uncharacterized protein n=1 Tax=Trichuris suis TaxID=68888 RepID=A0A085MT76_9BILA|nr:hypothetical protein M514_27379 [Trichuris suis]KFD61487.1 hypothetical protein M514_26300 [Trichuris suis]
MGDSLPFRACFDARRTLCMFGKAAQYRHQSGANTPPIEPTVSSVACQSVPNGLKLEYLIPQVLWNNNPNPVEKTSILR